jgi:small multidrug resistance family-3 protein
MKTILDQIVASPAGAFAVLALAAFLEVMGDACFQSGLHESAGAERAIWLAAGTLVLAAYGLFVNLPHWDFGKLLGIYVVLFFLIAQCLS